MKTLVLLMLKNALDEFKHLYIMQKLSKVPRMQIKLENAIKIIFCPRGTAVDESSMKVESGVRVVSARDRLD